MFSDPGSSGGLPYFVMFYAIPVYLLLILGIKKLDRVLGFMRDCGFGPREQAMLYGSIVFLLFGILFDVVNHGGLDLENGNVVRTDTKRR